MSPPVKVSWGDDIYESSNEKRWQYERLNQANKVTQQSRHRHLIRSCLRYLKVGGGLVLLWILLSNLPGRSTTLHVNEGSSQTPAVANSSYFHVVLTAPKANTDFCRTIFSAAALDYPTPSIINWGNVNDTSMARIGGTHEYLNQLGEAADGDLMLIADGYNTWFQLRPSVMIERFHVSNHRGIRRIRQTLGPRVAEEAGLSQRVLFSAQTQCALANPGDHDCDLFPEPGRATSIPRFLSSDPSVVGGAPRYLHSGVIMGYVGDLRPLFERAAEMARDESYDSDQAVFSQMFFEQEKRREAIRKRGLSWYQRPISETWRSIRGMQTDALEDPTSDFSIGLDYGGEISQPIGSSAAQDRAWLSRDAGRVSRLPNAIEQSTPPFWAADYIGQTGLPNLGWSQVSLFTNLRTEVSPALVDATGHGNGRADTQTQAQSSWRDTFYFLYLRSLLITKAKSYRMPVAVFEKPFGLEEWWDPIEERGGLRIETDAPPGDRKQWDDVCGTSEIAEEVFGDGSGPWVNPIHNVPSADKQEEPLEKWEARNPSDAPSE